MNQVRIAPSDSAMEVSQPRGVAVSGKTMTVVLLLVLLLSGLLFYWVTTAYATYNAARRQTDQSWRTVAALLETRYRALDSVLTTTGEAAPVDATLVQQWTAARTEFTGTSLTAHQVEAAERLEELISKLPESLQQMTTETDELRTAVAEYQTAIDTQQHVGNTPGSRLLKSMLVLRDPPAFHTAKH